MAFILLLAFSSILIIPSISASDVDPELYGRAKQYTPISLPQSGSNGTSSWDGCNITSITAPDGTVVLQNVAMIKHGFSFNYTFNDTNQLGQYYINTICYDGSGHVVPNFYKIEVTTTGKGDALSFWISIILVGFALIVLGLAYAFDSIYISFMSGILFIISGIMIYLKGFGSIQDVYSSAIGMVLFGFGLIIFFASAFYHEDMGNNISEAFGIQKEETDIHSVWDENGE